MIDINKRIIEDSIVAYGKEKQTIVCMEELAELIQALSKELRDKGDKENLIGEVADVWICLTMICEMYEIGAGELQTYIDYKQKRQSERMEEVLHERMGY